MFFCYELVRLVWQCCHYRHLEPDPRVSEAAEGENQFISTLQKVLQLRLRVILRLVLAASPMLNHEC